MLWPPYTRRPTWRLANCTGMRRWPCSMNTMATSNMMNTMMVTISALQPAAASMRVPWLGRVETTEAKISRDMPLPMPRWVMSSPIHMSRAVPVVRVSTISAT